MGAEQVKYTTVLAAELKRVRTSRKNRGVPDMTAPIDHVNPDNSADALELIGVSFSGGGIRSATFNLGILQALAKVGMLRHVDYLSTVSGGGYIGSWLNAMIHRADQTATGPKCGIDEIEPGLNPDHPEPPTRVPADAISYLRAYSNYLTPKLSALSADTWSMAAIWFRNTLLNLTILVSGIAALMLAARTFGMWALVNKPPGTDVLVMASLACVAIATAFLGLNVGEKLAKKWRTEGWVQRMIVLPVLAAAILITVLMRHQMVPLDIGAIFWAAAGVLAVLFLIFQLIAGFWGCFQRQHDHKLDPLWGVLLQIGVAALSGLVTAWLLHLVAELTDSWKQTEYFEWLMLTVCPAMVVSAITLGVIVNVGLLGRDIPDGVREWTGRLGAWMFIYVGGWMLFFGAAIYGPVWMQMGWGWARYAVTGGWVGATLLSLLAGKSAKTGKGSDKGDSSTKGMMDTVARLGPWVFMAGFVVAISLCVHEIVTMPSITQATPATRNAVVQVNETSSKVDVSVDSKSPAGDAAASTWQQYWDEMDSQDFFAAPGNDWYKGTVPMLLLCMAVALLMSWRVDINEFSLNHFYKNRLVRCYLGASRPRKQRDPDPFTHFDRHDDIRLNELDNDNFSGPFPIINTTLNLSSGRNLAWQERQGASFIFTPIYSGYDTGSDHDASSVSRQVRVKEGMQLPAYYPTHLVCKTEGGGINMGTAVGISGAAANPNQGFHTSTAVAFLMTVFDVRLGWWLGNPASNKAEWSGPAFGLPYTLSELFGTSNADSSFVDLSDGGHFENMGLYELIRRRCRYIIVCDAEQDEEFHFGGITTAVRMCRTDFGVEIKFKDGGLDRLARKHANKPENFSANHFAVADIIYPSPAPAGKLIYIKSSITGDEPVDVLGYHMRVPLFPHESTGDQWFDESQFESYRRLGQHVGEDVFAAAANGKTIVKDGKTAYFGAF
jgi:hypothetical protein